MNRAVFRGLWLGLLLVGAGVLIWFWQVPAMQKHVSPKSVGVSVAQSEKLSESRIPAELPTAGLVMLLDAQNEAWRQEQNKETIIWSDASGGNNDAVSVSDYAPSLLSNAIGDHAAIKFDGQDDYLNLLTGFEDFSAGLSLFLVIRPLVLHPGFKLIALGNGGGADNIVLGRNGNEQGMQYFTTDSNGNNSWFNTSDVLKVREPALFSVIQAAGDPDSKVAASIHKNGTMIGDGLVYVPKITARSVNYIARSYWNEGLFEGEIAEIIAYKRALSLSEQATVNVYLMQKYKLGQKETLPSKMETLTQQTLSKGKATKTSITSPITDSALPIPADIPTSGLLLLLDAENAAMDWKDGSRIMIWRDASGNANDAATPALEAAPVLIKNAIKGNAAIRFDGQDDYLGLSIGFEDFTAGMSLFIVARPLALQAGFKLLALGNGSDTDNLVLGRNGSNEGLQYFTTDSNGKNQWFLTKDALVAGEAALYSVLQAGGSPNSQAAASVSRNGAVIGDGAVYVPPVTTRSVNYIGRSYWNEGLFEGDIAEIIIYNRELNASEQAEVNNYLARKYALNSGV